MDHREFPILYVDDEPDNLRVFELTFRRGFTVLTAESGEAGIRLLHENPIAVVLSDYRMPGMNGVEFLSRTREVDPHAIRILVTAYGDVQILGDAINDGRIYKYIAKPWEPEDMRLTLQRAIESYALDREREGLLNELTLLNRLSHSLHRELDLDRLLELLLHAVHGELGFDGAAVLFFESGGERLAWARFAPRDDSVSERLRGVEFTTRTAPRFIESLRAGQAQSIHIDALDDFESPVREWATEVSADEIIVVPLVGKSEVIGALAVDQRSGGRRFGADDRTLLEGLAIQCVIAIENARLVHDLRSTREQVKRADRLGTLGTLAAGLAHEINNPLVSIHTFLSLAPEKRVQDDPEFWGEYHTLASGELERIRGLVATMSRLARGGSGEVAPGPIDLGELACEAAKLLQREARGVEVELEVDAKPNTPPVVAVRDHMQQVVLNLLCNAIHATPAGGRIDVRIGPDPDHPQDLVCLSVEDTGVGIAESDLERVFDPFYTTKDPDEGTGLGLMITHQIVADHGGAIEVRSAVGRGSCFRVKLPVKGAVTC